MIYAIVEASDEEKGVYRSTDFGATWEKRSDYMASSPQYYNELVVDPKDAERVYSMDTFARISEDGGKTWSQLSLDWRHVDDHALWIDPDNTEHLIIGGDGGIYESYDRGNTWRHIRNLSITQFYRIQPDEDEPFYNVCGGTQDNNSLCAPSRTTVIHGITNSDWTMILSGDGYKPQMDPKTRTSSTPSTSTAALHATTGVPRSACPSRRTPRAARSSTSGTGTRRC